MDESSYVLEGVTPTSIRLLKIFIASAIIDNNGSLDISRRSLAELSELCAKHKGFDLLATPTDDSNINLTLEWYA
jgi:hypothetical protein